MANEGVDKIDQIIQNAVLRALQKAPRLRAEGRCPYCGREIEHSKFRDGASRTEYCISGLCQKCQDEYHGR